MTDDEKAAAVVQFLGRCTVCKPPQMCRGCAEELVRSKLRRWEGIPPGANDDGFLSDFMRIIKR